ncbi:emp24/gp25L/p24 family/GOLD-domain-containing protein [Zychaea mexicana]|uniref:emp24/gp25L/p24 family/GOLD-domain-containing protein n=1 Tax=Zychaea mexicana TaxID=64656 RepID=UPI0022FDFBA6|nr:emp24/gp25L/p24 family/GOLD-domain-containing protein [Zychaea mexicana]KAI9489680.1 emp24/gp25L/p24 family/GOLD-domain-containing protein [Zychaea mexicana]
MTSASSTRLLTALLLVSLAIFAQVSDALYFYLEGTEKKCFLEELPKETMVTGTYKAEQFSAVQNQWIVNPDVRIQITVEELPQEHVVVERQNAASDRFTFTSADSGDHSICLSVVSSSWFDSTKTRMTFDMDFDDPSSDHHDHKETLGAMAMRIHELNQRVQDIRREQAFQREREAEYRDQSELTNSRVVWWTIMQIVVLGAICVWQMRHYKSFFVAKKLV